MRFWSAVNQAVGWNSSEKLAAWAVAGGIAYYLWASQPENRRRGSRNRAEIIHSTLEESGGKGRGR